MALCLFSLQGFVQLCFILGSTEFSQQTPLSNQKEKMRHRLLALLFNKKLWQQLLEAVNRCL